MADLSKVDSYQYPAAHFGHLSEEQQASLEKFKALIKERGYYHPAGEKENQHASHDDETLLYAPAILAMPSFDVIDIIADGT